MKFNRNFYWRYAGRTAVTAKTIEERIVQRERHSGVSIVIAVMPICSAGLQLI